MLGWGGSCLLPSVMEEGLDLKLLSVLSTWEPGDPPRRAGPPCLSFSLLIQPTEPARTPPPSCVSHPSTADELWLPETEGEA